MNKWLFLCVFFFTSLFAEEGLTRITSEGRLILDNKNKIANFFDHVIVKNDKGVLKSDKLIVYFDPLGMDIEKMIAEGNVFIDQKDHQAESDRAEYFSTDGKLILTGNPLIKKGENYYSADSITIDTKTNKVFFEPSAKIVIKRQEEEKN